MTNETPTPPLPDDSDAEAPDAPAPGSVTVEDDPAPDGADDVSDQPPPPEALGGSPRPEPVRRLVRDPYTRLGGVASGISHYTGLDTSIVRILFIITTFTGGFGICLYLLAWLVIPRADHWPPASAPVSYRNMSGRELGIGLAVVGLLVAVGFGASGTTGAILVPLVLVAGGVWLLVQPPSTPIPAGAGHAAAPFAADHGPIGAPVPPLTRRRKRWLIALGVLASMFALLLVPVIIVLGVVFGSLRDTTYYTPATIEEIPTSLSDDIDRIEIDLTDLDADDFSSRTMPVEIDADLTVGSILVIVPDDISVSVDSRVEAGSITVFGDSVDGTENSYRSSNANGDDSKVDLELHLDVDLGQIDVERP